MVVYGMLSMMMGYEIHRRFGSLTKKNVLIVILICSLYGICLEGVQLFFLSDRSFEIADIIANIIGSFVGIEIVYFFYRQKQNL